MIVKLFSEDYPLKRKKCTEITCRRLTLTAIEACSNHVFLKRSSAVNFIQMWEFWDEALGYETDMQKFLNELF